MPETKDDKRKAFKDSFDLYNYIGNGKTIYDVFDRYLELNGDYSIEKLMEVVRYIPELYNDRATKDVKQMNFVKEFDYMMSSFKREYESMSKSEKDQLLMKLSTRRFDFGTLDQALSVLKANTYRGSYYDGNGEYGVNPDISQMYDTLIREVVKVLPENERHKVKYTLLQRVIIPYMKHAIASKYPLSEAHLAEEWMEMDEIRIATSSLSDFEDYEKYLEEYNRDIARHEEEVAKKHKCERKRFNSIKPYLLREVKDAKKDAREPYEIGINASNESIEALIDSTLYAGSPEPANPKDYRWKIKEYKKPIVLCNGKTSYSKDGDEVQRVIAISYGKFMYETAFKDRDKMKGPTVTSEAIELIGVTRIGTDGLHTYFVNMPMNNVTLKKVKDLAPDDRVLDFVIDGKKKGITDHRTFEDYSFVEAKRVPTELEQYFIDVAFSDYHLSHSISSNDRFAGRVSLINGRPTLSTSYRANAQDLTACKHASMNSGLVDNKVYYSLNDYCESTELNARHLQLVKDLFDRKIKQSEMQEEEIR